MMKLILISAAAIICIAVLLTLKFSRSIPKKASPVHHFDIQKYLGKWFEIARFDFRFEKNLNNVTAEYTLLENGKIGVLNQGYDYVKKEWKAAEGKAKFRSKQNVAALKVSFFGPFYSAYNVIDLDCDYQYSMVAGKNLDYLWILSRKPILPENIRGQFLTKAQDIGYDISRLVWVEHAE